MVKLQKYLSKEDIFAHHVEFNINQNGKAHGTVSGGIVSIILKIVYALYLYILIHKMLHYDEL